MKHYLLPEKGTQYKACLHSHTTVSDGHLTPAEAKEVYKSRGYSILAMSDHEILVNHSDLNDENFLTLTSYEYAVTELDKPYNIARTVDMNLIARDPHNETQVCYAPNQLKNIRRGECWRIPSIRYAGEPTEKVFTPEYIQHVIDEAKANGFIVALNHPVGGFLSSSFLRQFNGCFAMEIYNQDCILCGINEYGIALYEELLRYGKPWSCIASDDSHWNPTTEFPSQGFVMIKADALQYDKVIAALEQGDFYASTGPTIEELYIEDGEVHMKCSPVKYIGMGTACRPLGGCCRAGDKEFATDLTFTHTEEFITEASFKLRDNMPYIRFSLLDGRGNWAHTRAYATDGSRAIPSTPIMD